MNASERLHLDRVAQLPCATCGEWPVEVHHLREGQGMGQRAGHYLTVPLCKSCHTGPIGIHGDKTMMRVAKMDEMDLLNDTLAKLEAGR